MRVHAFVFVAVLACALAYPVEEEKISVAVVASPILESVEANKDAVVQEDVKVAGAPSETEAAVVASDAAASKPTDLKQLLDVDAGVSDDQDELIREARQFGFGGFGRYPGYGGGFGRYPGYGGGFGRYPGYGGGFGRYPGYGGGFRHYPGYGGGFGRYPGYGGGYGGFGRYPGYGGFYG